jgi:gluconolactonase
MYFVMPGRSAWQPERYKGVGCNAPAAFGDSASMQTEISPFTAHAAEFADVLGDDPRLVHVVDTDAHEGPVYVADEDALYFTSVRRGTSVALKRLELSSGYVSVICGDANVANGMTLDREGRLVICEQGTFAQRARISRLDRTTGAAETVVDEWRGRRLNSPNDVVVRSDGTVWFTDPSYGYLQGFRPDPEVGDRVYRYDPATDCLALAAAGFDKPNGLAFSPDETILYVSDNGAPHSLLAFDVLDDGRLARGRVLAVGSPGHPDGLKVDRDGRIYASSSTGVEVFSPGGDLLGEIVLAGAVNFTFGGAGRNVLFITADTAVWAAVLNAEGV